MTNQLRWSLGVMLVLAACGQGVIEELPADEPAGEVVADEGTGDVQLAEPDPSAASCPQEPCEVLPFEPDGGEEQPEPEADAGPTEVDAGLNEVDAGLNEVDAGRNEVDAGRNEVDAGLDAGARLDAGVADAGRPDAGRPDAGLVDAGVNPWVAGAKVLVRGYVSFRSAASADAGTLTSVQPAGGITDSAHGGGMTRGLVPPGQAVILTTGTKTNGFYQVRYAGLTGWISASWLTPIPTTNRAAFAVQPAVRNAFFKHQLHRTKWNKDGPYSSGTCAPTSLSMLAHAFGKEPATLSVEESIHRTRLTYGATTDSTGTYRAQITTAATKLGLSVRVLDTRLSLADMLTRIDGQLAAHRMIVLEGQPTATYQAAFNRAYVAAGLSNRYTFSGRHSIAVLGRDGTGYVVGDPLSEVGMLELTGAELKAFFTTWGGTGNAVWAP